MNKRYTVLCVIFSMVVLIAGCRSNEEKPKIDKLEFQEKTRNMKIGENAAVGIKILPENAKTAERIKYTASGNGIIEIDEAKSSNDGVVFTAAGGGSAVISAKAQGIVDYLEVSVEGAAETGIPYITVTDNVLEVPLGTKKHFMSTLQNGQPNDYLSFAFSNREQNIIQYETANNTVVIEGLKPGTDIVTVKHPKAQYSVDVLVFVLEIGEYAKYITGDNVVFMESGKEQVYYTRLIGIGESETGYSVYQVIEGNDIITVSGSGEYCSISSKKEGVAKVRVTNRSVPYPFEFQVIVRGKEDLGYIAMSSSFVILEDNTTRNIYAYFNGNAPADINDKYTWYFEGDMTGIVEVTRYGDNFALKALKNGNVKLIIENEYSLVRQEVLIQVHFAEVSYGEKLITTSQNVIYMELGGVDAILRMKLTGGTQADKNNFEWVVEDSSIINAVVPDGNGTVYHRAMVSNDAVQEVTAKITAKKAGTTYITVTNTKTPRNEVRVLVKVYPRGMFSGNVVSLAGNSLLKVKKGETLNINAYLTGGSYQNTGELLWHIKDGKIAEVNGTGLSGIMTGLNSGITELIVTGQNVLTEYHAIIVVYGEGQEDSIPYIYTDRLQYKLYTGQIAGVYLYHPNIDDQNFDYSIMNTNTSIAYTRKQNDVIMIYAVEPGEAELVINTGIPECNTITIAVSVEIAEINTEKPYTITGDSFAVTYVGGIVEYYITMAGSSEADKSKIIWTVDDSAIASLEMANGTNIILRGMQTGQTVLRAQSAKSANVKEIIVFVTATQNDAYAKVMLGLPKINYILKRGESFFVKLVTNASENQKLQIRWRQSNADILKIEDNYDTAFITALEEGTCIITIDTRDNSHGMPLLMYVTVRSPVFEELQIGFPSSVVLLKGQSKVIKGNMSGSGGVHDFIWSLEDDTVVNIISSGLEATLWGKKTGQTFLTVSHYGFSKKILVICVENEDDLENVWYFTADKTYYRIKKDEEAMVNILFGENGFPDDEKKNIQWRGELNNGVVSLSASGASARITGENVGVARIIVSHNGVDKNIEILIEVIDSVIGSQEYYMMFPSINKMVSGVPQTIPISLYKDNHLYSQGYNLITAVTEGKGVVQVELMHDTLRVLGRKEGKEYITLTHPMAGEYRMLVIVYEGQMPDDSNPVIYVDKQYWSVYEGKEETITLTIAGGDEYTGNKILWMNYDPQIIRVDSSKKTVAKITGLSLGSTSIDIIFNGNLTEKIHVSVAKGNVNTDIVVSTESIIVMALDTDTQHMTKAIGGGNITEFYWSIKDERIAEILESGDRCLIYPVKKGVTELTVSGYNYERKIIIVVVQTEVEKMNSKYLNIDKRYYKVKRGESTVIYPYYKMAKPSVPANFPDLHYDSGVVNIGRHDEGFVITGKNEGIELITIGNDQCENSIQIAVEVQNEISGGITDNPKLVYLTTENNIIVTSPNTYGILIKIDIIGEYLGTNADFIWSRDSTLIEWEVSGTVAFINTKEKTGEVNITIENSYCQYPLKIKIIVEEDIVVMGSPYIYADKTVYQLSLTDDVLRINYKINNMDTVDYSGVAIIKNGNSADVNLNGNYLEIRPKTQGVCDIEIKYPGALSLKLYFIVSDNIENTAVYLTTTMNYVIVPKAKTKMIDISLMNYTELNSDNIKWYSSDHNTVTVVGTGRTVQIYGVETGFAKLTVKHAASYNDLEIMVKVVDEHDVSNVAYLTTKDNIIETFVQNNSLPVMINKIGGKLPELEIVWSVDDPSIVSVMGNGSIAYIVPKKAGVAKITVTERETGKLDIVVIVKEVKEGTEYIATEETVVQINPGNGNHTIQVRLVGGNELDIQKFEWQIYSQLPSDYEVAKNGGMVISLFGMGDRAAISGNYTGTARIRVTHPKAQLPLYIVVQVTNYNDMTFNEREAVIVNGEIYFAGIRVPNYENFTGKVEYSTDNPAVCVVTGSDKVALLQSQGVGKANITAIIKGTSLQASIEVSVIERDNYTEPNIIVPKTTYLLNPRERPFQIEAYLQGAGVTEEMRYGIKWEAALYNGSDHGMILDAIDIYPSVTAEKPLYSGGNTTKVLQGSGPIIQIEVLNPKLPEGQSFQPKEIVIVVSQPEVTSRTKTIYIKISEISGIFTLNKSDITMESGHTADLSCKILGGMSSDYKEVVWLAEVDTTGREIALIMPDRGKDVHVYGVNDGTVYITAIYRNEIAECRVQVKSNVYLRLQYETFFTYPGARQENNQLIEVEFEVRPYTTQIMWTPQGATPDPNNPAAIVTAVTQDYSTGKGKITIEPIKEGSFEIIGIMSGKVTRMTVIIKNVYRFQISNRQLVMQPGSEYVTKYNPVPNPGLYWDYDSKYNVVPDLVKDDFKIGGSVYIPFIICPPDHRIEFCKDTKSLMKTYDIQYEISPVVKYNEMEGRGIIKLTVNKEIPKAYPHYGKITLELDLKKPLEESVIDPELYSANPLSPNNCIFLTSLLPMHQTAVIPVFQRVYGTYSNENGLKYKYYDRLNQNNNYRNETALANENSPGNNKFDINASTWQEWPTGVLPEFNNAIYANSTSEYIRVSERYKFDTNSGHRVTYNLEIGDGEEHYILLDKTHANMFYEFIDDGAIKNLNQGFLGKYDFYKNKSGRAPSAELKTLDNGDKAILIKGGKDLVIYDRIKIINRRKFTFMYFSPNASADRVYTFSFPNNILSQNVMIDNDTDPYNHPYDITQSYCRFFYKINGNLFQWWDDQRYQKTNGDLYNYNDGKKYKIYLTEPSGHYLMLMNRDSKFRGKSNFRDISDSIHNEGYFYPRRNSNLTILYNDLKKLNYRAIIAALNHNISMGKIPGQAIRNLLQTSSASAFETAFDKLTYDQKIELYNLLHNDNGSIMGSYTDKYIESVPERVQGYGEVIPAIQGNEYSVNSLYVKRETEKNHNQIYDLNKFESQNLISGINLSSLPKTDYPDRTIITEDITCNGNYEPVATNKQAFLHTAEYPLTITYANSYGSSNRVTIKIIHKVRGDNCNGLDGITASWDQVDMVNQYEGISGFSKFYGYFFVDNDY